MITRIVRTNMAQYASLLVIAIFSIAASANAAVVVSTSVSAPTDNVISSFAIADSPTPTGYQWRNSTANGRRDLGEIFYTTTALDLEAVTLQLQSGSGSGSLGAAFTVTILKFSSTGSTPVYETVATVSGVIPTTSYTANTYMTFDVSSANVSLSANSTYGFLLSFDSQAASRAISFQYVSTAGATPNGLKIESADGSTITTSTTSLEFYIQATAANVPESSSAAAIAGFVVIGFVALRRRGR